MFDLLHGIFSRRTHFAAFSCAVLSLFLAGCTSVPPDAGFTDAQSALRERGQPRIVWRRDSAQDAAADAEVRELLKIDLTADSAVQIALLNNRNLQASFEDLGVAQADLVQAGLLKNPVFSAEIRFPGHPFDFDVVADFLDILLLPARKGIAEAHFQSAWTRTAGGVQEHAAATRAAYYTLQGAQQMAEMRHSIAKALDLAAQVAGKLHEAGNLSDLDLASQQVEAQQASIAAVRADADAAEQRELLIQLMGLAGPDAVRWTISSRLPEPDPTDRLEIPPDATASSIVPLAATANPATSTASLESLALSRRLDLRALVYEIDSLEKTYNLRRSTALLGEIEVSAHVEGEPEGRTTAGPSIAVPLPIFDQGQATTARAQAQWLAARQHYLALEVEIRSQVRIAAARVRAANAQAAYYRDSVIPLRQQIVRQTQLQYNAMNASVFQLLEARQNEIEAGRAYVESLRDYWLARVELERALGTRNPVSSTTQPTTQP